MINHQILGEKTQIYLFYACRGCSDCNSLIKCILKLSCNIHTNFHVCTVVLCAAVPRELSLVAPRSCGPQVGTLKNWTLTKSSVLQSSSVLNVCLHRLKQ